ITRFTAIAATLLASPSINAQEPTEEASDTTRAQELKEIVVDAERIIRKPGRDILILSEQNKAFGVNALEAISSMNYFLTEIGGTELISYDRQPVLITINGVPSTGEELCTYKAEQILRVEYFAITPAEFMGQTSGPVINVVTRKPRTRMISGYFNLRNSVSTLSGVNNGNLIYSDPHNRIRAAANVGYTNTNSQEENSIFEYGPEKINEYKKKGKLNSSWQNLDLTYQRDQGPHMFSVGLSGSHEGSREHYNGVADIVDGTINASGTMVDFSKLSAERVALNLYYHFSFGSGKTIALSAANTLGRSESRTSLLREVEAPYDMLNYDVASANNNKTYAFNSTAAYMMPMPNGQLTAAVNYSYSRLKQTGMGSETRPEMNNVSAFANYMWMKGGFQITPSVGLASMTTKTSAGTDIRWKPSLNLTSAWYAPKGRLYGWAARLQYRLLCYTTSLGNLANSINYLDYSFISTGNPNLRPYHQHAGRLSLEYMSPDGRNSFTLSAYPSYGRNPMAPIISKEGEMFVLHYDNIHSTYSNGFSMMGAWYALPWLRISPYLDYSYRCYKIEQRTTSYGQWRLGGSIAVSKNHFEMWAAFNPPIKRIDGYLFERQSTQAACSVRYKTGPVSVSCEYRYSSQNEYTLGRIPEFMYKTESSRKCLAQCVTLSLTYSFQKGKQTNHADALLQDGNSDTGLDNFSSIKR
ncbi:MAG: outer membrane beta-barrel protein, partial [Muribaculaceae bacterium]|nr:outer membrane beta-barrel protein [Muribaculaceae bacterium]